jgi:DNA-directed RNA polymerase specialized sigma24 family protein
MGRYLNPSDQGERIRRVLEMVPLGPQIAIPRTRKQVHRRLQPVQIDELADRYLAGATLKELSKQYRVHRTTVSELLEQRGVQRRYRSLSVDQVAEAVKLYESGLSLVRVGDVLQANSGTVWQALKRKGVPLRDCHGRAMAINPCRTSASSI